MMYCILYTVTVLYVTLYTNKITEIIVKNLTLKDIF